MIPSDSVMKEQQLNNLLDMARQLRMVEEKQAQSAALIERKVKELQDVEKAYEVAKSQRLIPESQELPWLERRRCLRSELADLINAHYDGHNDSNQWMIATSKQIDLANDISFQ
jgi:hypothetical protein